MTLLDVDVVKAVHAGVSTTFVRRLLLRAAAVPEVAARLPEGRGTVAVRITDDVEMERLNSQFAHDPGATDVLSFEGEGEHIGDIAISWPRVVTQAQEWGHSEADELAVLLVHGFLHLLGWDHRTPAETEEMWRLTNAPLKPQRSGYTRGTGLRRSPRA